MPRIAEETRLARRRRLIDAAWRCAASGGYRSWTVDDVCAEAQVSKGAFYGYFSGKGELLLALLEDDGAWADGIVATLTASALPARERLRRFIQLVLQRREEPGRVQIRADLWGEMLTDPSVRTPFVALIRRRRRVIQSWIEATAAEDGMGHVPARALASTVLALTDGLTLHRAIDPTAFQWSNVRHAVEMLLSGIERSAEHPSAP